MATVSLLLGIVSSGEIYSALELIHQEDIIPLWNLFLSGIDSSCMKEGERAHVQDNKSIPVSTIEVSCAMGDIQFLFGSYSVSRGRF
jgi:hypothetical protein